MHFAEANKHAKALQTIYIYDYAAVALDGSEPLKNYSLYHLFVAEQIQFYSNDLGNDGTKENESKMPKLVFNYFISFMKKCFSYINKSKEII